jgi:ankyrin repeat protein
MKNMIYNYKRFTEEYILNENIFDKIFNKNKDIDWNNKLLNYSSNGNLKGVKKCLENGADVNCEDNDGWTPLISSSNNGYLEIVKVLIENGADVNCKCKCKYGSTPLIWASRYDNLEIVKLLIENGADWNMKDKDKKDFMNYLSKKNKEIIIREYPEQYKEYLFKKDVEKYNL